MCVEVSGVRVVELLNCAVLLLGECLKKSGSVLEGDECLESKGRRLFDREVCRLCESCVCMLVGDGEIIESDCDEMSG